MVLGIACFNSFGGKGPAWRWLLSQLVDDSGEAAEGACTKRLFHKVMFRLDRLLCMYWNYIQTDDTSLFLFFFRPLCGRSILHRHE